MNAKAENTTTPDSPPQLDHGADGPIRVLLITGMSGAGRSAALKALEDVGYEAVDNLPLSLLTSLVRPSGLPRRALAIGVDIRTRDFGVEPFMRQIEELVQHDDLEVRLVFLDCEDEELRRRFTETRRPHPLATDRPVTDGIRHERRLLSPLRDHADQVIDTTGLGLNDLRRQLHGKFSLDVRSSFALFVMSFAYRNGLPREADLVFDARFLANPHYEANLRELDGTDAAVGEFISADPGYDSFFDSLTALLQPLLPRFRAEGKSYLTIAVGCTGGRHRSVFIAERLAAWLQSQGQQVNLAHRELDR